MNGTMTQEQHDAAVAHVLTIVDEMIRLHELRRGAQSHSGLCFQVIYAIEKLHGYTDYASSIESSMFKLMRRHIMPPGSGRWWFGGRNAVGWQRRRDALDVLRTKVAAGDIHPNPPIAAGTPLTIYTDSRYPA